MRSSTPRANQMGDLPRLELLTGLQRYVDGLTDVANVVSLLTYARGYSLYRTRDYTDLILVGGDGSRHGVHKAVICPRSQYFSRAVQERRWSARIPMADVYQFVRDRHPKSCEQVWEWGPCRSRHRRRRVSVWKERPTRQMPANPPRRSNVISKRADAFERRQ